jgi:hypothetical protein
LANGIVTEGHLISEHLDLILSMNMNDNHRWTYFHPNGILKSGWIKSGWIFQGGHRQNLIKNSYLQLDENGAVILNFNSKWLLSR